MTGPIWLLATKGRPEMCQEVLDACLKTGMRSPGVVYVDETVDEYQDIVLPANWIIHFEPVWGGIGEAMRWTLDRYPDASSYGWLADDTFPRTPAWDLVLERAAGDWCLSYGRDIPRDYPHSARRTRESGEDFGVPMCWGGELVHAVGWWAVPGVRQGGIDTAWSQIIRPLHLSRYVTSVFCEHRSFRDGKRPPDPTDEQQRNGVKFIEEDLKTMTRWRRSREYQHTIERVREAMA